MRWRKITVGDRDWRLVWRVTYDDAGAVIVDVAEDLGVRRAQHVEMYQEMAARIATALQNPPHQGADVLAPLGRLTDNTEAAPELATPEPPPKWLQESLLCVVRLPADQVDAIDRDGAEQVWLDHTRSKGR